MHSDCIAHSSMINMYFSALMKCIYTETKQFCKLGAIVSLLGSY